MDKLLENQLKGPESFASRDDGYLYTGLISGLIVRIDTVALTAQPVARIGGKCEEQYQEQTCGRPLGMAFTKTGKLIGEMAQSLNSLSHCISSVCDAVYGLYLIDIDKKQEEENRISEKKYEDIVDYSPLLTPDKIINGSQNFVFNSLVMSSDDETVYLTVSSTNFHLSDSLWEVSSTPSGRVIQFNLRSQETKVLVSDISFANGIEMDPEEKFLIFCETGRARLHKYYLKGDKAGTHEVFLESLPGLPDNIK